MPTWETQTDWDSATSENGVVHESVANVDHSDATLLKQGYSAASPFKSADLGAYYPLHEDSGSTAYDQSGNNNDGTISGATLNASAPLGTTAYSFDGDFFGSTDNVNTGYEPSLTGDFTLALWFRGGPGKLLSTYGESFTGVFLEIGPDSEGGIDFFIGNGFANFGSPQKDEWTFLVGRRSGSTAELFVNGSSIGSFSNSADGTGSEPFHIASSTDDRDFFQGKIWDVRIYPSTALTDSEIQTLYDVVAAQSSLTTATKSL